MSDLRNVRPFPKEGKKEDQSGDLSAFALTPAAVPPDFVAKVMRGLPDSFAEPVRRRMSSDLWKWAAALLIFSAAVGYGFSIAEQTSESVASLTSTSDTSTALLGAL